MRQEGAHELWSGKVVNSLPTLASGTKRRQFWFIYNLELVWGHECEYRRGDCQFQAGISSKLDVVSRWVPYKLCRDFSVHFWNVIYYCNTLCMWQKVTDWCCLYCRLECECIGVDILAYTCLRFTYFRWPVQQGPEIDWRNEIAVSLHETLLFSSFTIGSIEPIAMMFVGCPISAAVATA